MCNVMYHLIIKSCGSLLRFNDCLSAIAKCWMCDNKLTLNCSKTQIILGTKSVTVVLKKKIQLDYCNFAIFWFAKMSSWSLATWSSPRFKKTAVQIINHVSSKRKFWENREKQSQCLHSYFNWNKLTNSSKIFWSSCVNLNFVSLNFGLTILYTLLKTDLF